MTFVYILMIKNNNNKYIVLAMSVFFKIWGMRFHNVSPFHHVVRFVLKDYSCREIAFQQICLCWQPQGEMRGGPGGFMMGIHGACGIPQPAVSWHRRLSRFTVKEHGGSAGRELLWMVCCFRDATSTFTVSVLMLYHITIHCYTGLKHLEHLSLTMARFGFGCGTWRF